MTVIEELLKKLDPVVNDMVEKSRIAIEKKQGYPMSEYDKKYLRLNVIYDLVRSFEKYTKPSDKLGSFNVRGSVKGSLEFSGIIYRDGDGHSFLTNVIYAGGYNIQVLHYRYLTSTTLPKTNNDSLTKQLKLKLAKLSKLEKIQKEIERYERSIKKSEETISEYSKLSDEELYDRYLKNNKYQPWPSWKEIVKRGADKNYNYSEKEYNIKYDEYRQHSIDHMKYLYISSNINRVQDLKKSIKKLESKLENL